MKSILDDPGFLSTLFFPRADHGACPGDAVDRFASSEDGEEIHLRLHEAVAPSFTVLFFHGNGEIAADYDDLAPEWRSLGVEFIVGEFRGYGKSTGTPTLHHLLTDAHLVLDQVDFGDRPLVVMGRSLGSIPAVELAASRSEVSGLIVESGMADPAGILSRRGVDLDAVDPEELAGFDNAGKVSRTDLPLLVLHGALDYLISPSEGAALHAASPARNKTLTILDGVGHNEVMLAREAYFGAVGAFLASLAH